MSDPRYTDPPRIFRDPIDLPRRSQWTSSGRHRAQAKRNAGIIAAAIATILIVGGIIYWSNSGSYNVATYNASPAAGLNTPAPTAPAAPTTSAPATPAPRQY